MQKLKYSVASEEPQQAASSSDERKTERQRVKYERLTKVLVAVKAGIQHLAERLEGVKLEEPPLVLTDDNMVEVLMQCEQRLKIVLDAIRQEEEALVREVGEAALHKPSAVPLEAPVVNNYRVRDLDVAEEAPSEAAFEEDLEEEEVRAGIAAHGTKSTAAPTASNPLVSIIASEYSQCHDLTHVVVISMCEENRILFSNCMFLYNPHETAP